MRVVRIEFDQVGYPDSSFHTVADWEYLRYGRREAQHQDRAGNRHVISTYMTTGGFLIYVKSYLLDAAAAVELCSEHPLGKAIVTRAKAGGRPIADGEDFTYQPERGVSGR